MFYLPFEMLNLICRVKNFWITAHLFSASSLQAHNLCDRILLVDTAPYGKIASEVR